MPRRTACLLRLRPFGFEPAFIVKTGQNGVESTRLGPRGLAQIVAVTPGGGVFSKSTKYGDGLLREAHAVSLHM